MKLLLFAQQFKDRWSGLGTYARSLVLGLSERGHEVTLAAPEEQCETVEGISLRPMRFRPWNLTPFSIRRMGREFRRVFKDAAEFDLCHLLDAREAALLTATDSPPLVGTVHDSYALDWKVAGPLRGIYSDRRLRGLYYAWLRRLESRAYRRLSLLIANSRHVADAAQSGYGLSGERIRVVELGLPTEPDALPADLPGDPSILFVGAGYERKGLSILMRALAGLQADLPGIHLHVVGGDRRLPRFRTLAETLDISEAVTFFGPRPNSEIRSLMAGADIYAMPSLTEAVGLTYLEAARAGTPVIATARGGIGEYLPDGEAAILVPPGDVQALSDALRRMATEEGLSTRLAERGGAAAREFTVEAMVSATESAYLSRTARGGAGAGVLRGPVR